MAVPQDAARRVDILEILKMKTVTIQLIHCGDECPHYIPSEVDEAHGCIYYPPRCRKQDREIRKIVMGNQGSFPIWCPLNEAP